MSAELLESEAVTISSKYQIVIPRAIRKQLNLKPGQKLRLVPYDGRIWLVPVRPIAELEGLFPGLEPFVREDDDEERVP